jgi:hypothetical protein
MIKLRDILTEALNNRGLRASTAPFETLGNWDKYNNKLWFGEQYKSAYVVLYSKPVPPQLRKSNTLFNLLVRSGEHPSQEPFEAIKLDSIHVPASEQGQGKSKDILKKICNVADQNGIWMYLDASPFGEKTLSTQQLVKLYESFGFIAISMGAKPGLVRPPIKADASGIDTPNNLDM